MFIDDIEKMTDFLSFMEKDGISDGIESFKNSYPYITGEEIDETAILINPETLAYLYRQAENYYIDELNGRKTGLAVTSEQAKDAIASFVKKFFEDEDIMQFEHLLQNMGC